MRSVIISWRSIAPLLSVLLILGLCTLLVPLWLGRLSGLADVAKLQGSPWQALSDILAAITVTLGNGS